LDGRCESCHLSKVSFSRTLLALLCLDNNNSVMGRFRLGGRVGKVPYSLTFFLLNSTLHPPHCARRAAGAVVFLLLLKVIVVVEEI